MTNVFLSGNGDLTDIGLTTWSQHSLIWMEKGSGPEVATFNLVNSNTAENVNIGPLTVVTSSDSALFTASGSGVKVTK